MEQLSWTNVAKGEAWTAIVKRGLTGGHFITVLTLTEKQFASMEHMLGEPDTDVMINDEKVVVL